MFNFEFSISWQILGVVTKSEYFKDFLLSPKKITDKKNNNKKMFLATKKSNNPFILFKGTGDVIWSDPPVVMFPKFS